MRVGVMHLTDTLGAGGAERVAVNIANHLPRERFASYLCTTREDGALANLIEDDVGRLRLKRQKRFDVQALRELVGYIRRNKIGILHAHQTSVFVAVLASLFPPFPKVVWHDHYGKFVVASRPVWLYKQAARRICGVIAVNQSLAEWSRRSLHMPRERVWYIPNFTIEAKHDDEPITLAGKEGARIVCVANFRRQKDHLNLIKAMKIVVEREPAAHLFLVGVEVDREYISEIRAEINNLNLDSNISWLGERSNVAAILKQCDVGVLGSASEGLPLALIEYGMAGLAAVATEVGQCGEVLDNGKAGMLVPPAAPDLLAEKLLALLSSATLRKDMGDKFRQRVKDFYSPEAVLGEVCQVYETVINSSSAVLKN